MKWLCSFLLMTIVSCTNASDTKASKTKPTNSTEDGKSLDARFSRAWNRKDSASIMQQLADDVEVLSGTAHYKGLKEALDRWIRYELPVSGNLQTTIIKTGEGEKTVYSLGTFSLDVEPPGTKPFIIKGNYSFVWEKEKDGSWKMKSILIEDLPQ